MSYEHSKGRRFITLVRCSADEQANTSLAGQAALLRAFGREHGLIHASGDVVLDGVSGSVPGARDDLDLIRERKMAADDFDVLLVEDSARVTRGGNAVIFALGTAGIDVVCINEHSTGDEEQDAVFQTPGFWAAQKMAKDLSFATTRGQMSSLANGFIPHTPRIPYGVDRLYVGPNGKPRHRIANLPDGTQQLLRPKEEVVVTTYAKSPKKGRRRTTSASPTSGSCSRPARPNPSRPCGGSTAATCATGGDVIASRGNSTTPVCPRPPARIGTSTASKAS